MTVKQRLAKRIDWMRKQAQVDQQQGQQPQPAQKAKSSFAQKKEEIQRQLQANWDKGDRQDAEYWAKEDPRYYNSMYGHKYGKLPSAQSRESILATPAPKQSGLLDRGLRWVGNKLWNRVKDNGRDMLGAFNAVIGAGYGGLTSRWDSFKKDGISSLIPFSQAGWEAEKNAWKAMAEYGKEGWRLGHRAGEIESIPERVTAQLMQGGQKMLDSVGLMPQGVKNALKIDQWNDKLALQAMQRAGVKVPETLPTDENGKLVPTGDPRYADYDNFVNWSDYGSSAAEFALSVPAFGAAGKAAVGLAGKGARMAHLGTKATKILTGAAGKGVKGYMGYQLMAKPMGQAAIDGYREGIQTAEQERHYRELDEFNRAFQGLFQYEPGSPEYDQYYDQLMAAAEMIPGADEIVNYYLE